MVSITITTATPLDLMIGDTTLIYGKKYKLNQLPQITKNGERNYTYELTLEGAQYDLIDVQYHLPEDCYGDTFYSDLGGHLDVLMWNISRVYPGALEAGELSQRYGVHKLYSHGKELFGGIADTVPLRRRI